MNEDCEYCFKCCSIIFPKQGRYRRYEKIEGVVKSVVLCEPCGDKNFKANGVML